MALRRFLPFLTMLGPLVGLALVAIIFRLPFALLVAACIVAIGETALITRLVRCRGRGSPESPRDGTGHSRLHTRRPLGAP